MTAPTAAELRQAIATELHGNLLPFWRQRSSDRRGGFVTEMANDGTVREQAPLGLILAARLLWGFSALYRNLGDERDLELARRAAEVLHSRLWDRAHGGYLWRVDAGGRQILDGAKKTYGQAFAIYAWSEHHLATGDREALARARAVYDLVEKHAHDERCGGYLVARARDWTATGDLRLSDKDLNVAKSMNTHLHVLEAYTCLYRAAPAADVARRLRELVTLFTERIFDSGGSHLGHFFDGHWRRRAEGYTFGHDIEAAWLLCEAAEVLGDAELGRVLSARAVRIARAVLAEALDEDGGVAYAGRNGAVVDPNREWWCQAEAVVGLWHAHQITGEAEFAEAAARVWGFIESRVVDRRGGEWFWRVRPDGSVDEAEPKVSEWKGPYHNVRMCLEIMRRIGGGRGGAQQ